MSEPRANLDHLIRHVEQQDSNHQPLAQLAHAVIVAERLDSLADKLVGHFVERARAAGASWAEVGHSLGVTKQAAQKRFVADARTTADAGVPRYVDLFTGRARAAHMQAVEEARAAKHDYVGTEHLLLALLRDPESRAVQALQAAGVALDEGLAAVTATLHPHGEHVGDAIQFSAAARKAEELAVREARRLRQDAVGTEHLLLGLFREGGTAAKVLGKLDVQRRALEDSITSHTSNRRRKAL
jgi:Clp amino terminal domain, pathogenicity island component